MATGELFLNNGTRSAKRGLLASLAALDRQIEALEKQRVEDSESLRRLYGEGKRKWPAVEQALLADYAAEGKEPEPAGALNQLEPDELEDDPIPVRQ